MQIYSANLWRAADLRAVSISETPELVRESPGVLLKRGRVYLLFLGLLCPPRVVVRCFRVFTAMTKGSDPIQSRSATYLLCKTRTSGANVFGLVLFVCFLFLKASFTLARTVPFLLAPLVILQAYLFVSATRVYS